MHMIQKITGTIFLAVRVFFCACCVIPLLIALKITDWFSAYERGRIWFQTLLFWIYKVLLWFSGIPVHFEQTVMPVNPPAIVVVNHESALDILFVGRVLGKNPQLWFAKHELITMRGLFFVRWLLARVTIMVNLEQSMERIKTMLQAIERVDHNKPYIIFFPEGGRYTNNRVQAFFGGFAMLARKTGLPVIPIFIKGSGKVLAPGSLLLRKAPVLVRVGRPFTYRAQETDDAFKERVRQWFIESQ